jgi:hypothetical protein
MRPRSLMLMGAFVGILGGLATAVLHTGSGGLPVLIFAGGMVFGKGYGVWEERARKP